MSFDLSIFRIHTFVFIIFAIVSASFSCLTFMVIALEVIDVRYFMSKFSPFISLPFSNYRPIINCTFYVRHVSLQSCHTLSKRRPLSALCYGQLGIFASLVKCTHHKTGRWNWTGEIISVVSLSVDHLLTTAV